MTIDGGGSVVIYSAPVCPRERRKGSRKRMKTNLELLNAQLQLNNGQLLNGVLSGFEM